MLNIISFQRECLICLSINFQLKQIFPPNWLFFFGLNSSFFLIYYYSALFLLFLQKLYIKLGYVPDRGSFKIQHHQKYYFSFVCTRNLYNFKTVFFILDKIYDLFPLLIKVVWVCVDIPLQLKGYQNARLPTCLGLNILSMTLKELVFLAKAEEDISLQ